MCKREKQIHCRYNRYNRYQLRCSCSSYCFSDSPSHRLAGAGEVARERARLLLGASELSLLPFQSTVLELPLEVLMW